MIMLFDITPVYSCFFCRNRLTKDHRYGREREWLVIHVCGPGMDRFYQGIYCLKLHGPTISQNVLHNPEKDGGISRFIDDIICL